MKTRERSNELEAKFGHIKKGCDFCSIKDDKFDKLIEHSFSSGVNGMLKLDNTYILDCSEIVEIDNLILPNDCIALYFFTGNRLVKIKNIVFSPSFDIGSCYISNLIGDNIKSSLVRWVTECRCKDINFY